MQRFSYIAFNAEGRQQKGHVEASDLADARRKLKANGLSISALAGLETGQMRPSHTVSHGLFRPRFNMARFFADLSVLMNAGLGIDLALRAMHDNASRNVEKQTIGSVLDRLASGASPSAALSGIADLPQDVAALVASGERSARLPHVVQVVAKDLQRREAQRKQVIDAAVYPVFLLCIMGVAIGIVTFVLVPTLEPIFESSGRARPFIVAALSGLRAWLTDPLVFFTLLIGFAVALSIGVLRPSAVKGALSAVVAETPLLGRALHQSALARYLQSLGLLLDNAVPLSEALVLAARCCPASAFRERLLAMRETVVSGKRLSEALSATGLFPRGVVSLVAIGDEVNRLPAVLENASGILRTDSQRLIDRLLALMTPAITILLGMLVGGLVISVMTALLGINELSMQ